MKVNDVVSLRSPLVSDDERSDHGLGIIRSIRVDECGIELADVEFSHAPHGYSRRREVCTDWLRVAGCLQCETCGAIGEDGAGRSDNGARFEAIDDWARMDPAMPRNGWWHAVERDYDGAQRACGPARLEATNA